MRDCDIFFFCTFCGFYYISNAFLQFFCFTFRFNRFIHLGNFKPQGVGGGMKATHGNLTRVVFPRVGILTINDFPSIRNLTFSDFYHVHHLYYCKHHSKLDMGI